MALSPSWLALFLGVTFGLFVALMMATLFFAARNTKAAATVLVVGLILIIGTLALCRFS